VKNNIEDKMGTFTDTFAPLKKEDVALSVILDIVTIGYVSFAAPTWGKVVKQMDFARRNGGNFDTLKDFTNGMVTQGMTLTKDILASKKTALDVQNSLAFRTSIIVETYLNSIVAFAATVFGGKGDGLDLLSDIIADGKMIDSGLDTLAVNETSAAINKALYAQLIPMAWRQTDRDLNPL